MLKTTLRGSGDLWELFKGGQWQDNFSWNDCAAIFDYFEELSEGTGEDIDMDPGAIACEFGAFGFMELVTEYSWSQTEKTWVSGEGCLENFDRIEPPSDDRSHGYDPFDPTDEQHREAVIDWFRDRTTVIEVERGSGSSDEFPTSYVIGGF